MRFLIFFIACFLYADQIIDILITNKELLKKKYTIINYNNKVYFVTVGSCFISIKNSHNIFHAIEISKMKAISNLNEFINENHISVKDKLKHSKYFEYIKSMTKGHVKYIDFGKKIKNNKVFYFIGIKL